MLRRCHDGMVSKLIFNGQTGKESMKLTVEPQRVDLLVPYNDFEPSFQPAALGEGSRTF